MNRKSWKYKTTWVLEEVPDYWKVVWGERAFNCSSLKRQWTILSACQELGLRYMDQLVGSFSFIV